jgi:hypothetical protein
MIKFYLLNPSVLAILLVAYLSVLIVHDGYKRNTDALLDGMGMRQCKLQIAVAIDASEGFELANNVLSLRESFGLSKRSKFLVSLVCS